MLVSTASSMIIGVYCPPADRKVPVGGGVYEMHSGAEADNEDEIWRKHFFLMDFQPLEVVGEFKYLIRVLDDDCREL